MDENAIIYLDNNATTRPGEPVRAAVDAALREYWHNPSSIHRPGQAARRQVELARAALAELIGARARQITLTGSGTEAIDLAIRGTLEAWRPPGAKSDPPVIITTRIEHAAVRDLVEDLEKTGRAEVRWAPIGPGGIVDVAGLAALVDDRAAIISVQWANNETGVLQPVQEIAALARARAVPFHCDATQWVGKMETEVGRHEGTEAQRHEGGGDSLRPSVPSCLDASLLTFSPHKFHGPKGVGVLWAGQGVRLRPVIHGAQELGRRGGTENVPGIIGAGVAAREALAWLARPGERERLTGLRNRLERGVLERIPDAVVNAPPDRSRRLWNTTNIGFPRLEAEALLLLLSERGVCASAGAACSSGSLEPSPVLLAMGVAPEVAHGSLRFSLSRETTAEEIERAIAAVVAAVEQLRKSGTPHC
ncbi:MAG: cysteine desulfurase [Phycisphaerales bacterium]|nr:cysteine desulfurase [Phycisphaerales bacterium]